MPLAAPRARRIAALAPSPAQAVAALAVDEVACGAPGPTLLVRSVALKDDERTGHSRHLSASEVARDAGFS